MFRHFLKYKLFFDHRHRQKYKFCPVYYISYRSISLTHIFRDMFITFFLNFPECMDILWWSLFFRKISILPKGLKIYPFGLKCCFYTFVGICSLFFTTDFVEKESYKFSSVWPSINPWCTFPRIWSLLFSETFQQFGHVDVLKSDDFSFLRKNCISSTGFKFKVSYVSM